MYDQYKIEKAINLLPKNIKKYRERKGWSQQKLAEEVGYKNRVTVYQFEVGRKIPDSITLLKIADVLEVSITDILTDKLENDDTVIYTGPE